ncbi:MAG: hypothetical protein E7195_08955 [Peptococcaceae bacterium]|nr:hypothetical protein [Peptococcaceae bacterium]
MLKSQQETQQQKQKAKGGKGIRRKRRRKIPNYILYWPYVVALVPVYDRNHNTWTRVQYIDGQSEEYPCRCEALLEKLAVMFHTTLEVVRGRAVLLDEGAECGELRKVPLVMFGNYSFVPVKCRREVVRNSGSLAYVVYPYVKHIEQKPGNMCEIVFKNPDVVLLIMQHITDVEEQMERTRNLHRAKEMEEQYWQYEICNARKAVKKIIQKQEL